MTTIKAIKDRLAGRPPGVIDKHRFFSVTIPLVETGDGLCLAFEVRSAKLKHQPGDICFPGGKIEEGETPLECALRETEEETGIDAGRLEVLGQFDTLHSFSGYTLYTFPVAVKEEDFRGAVVSPEEVEELFLAPLSFFAWNQPGIYDVDVVSDVKDFPYEETGISPAYKWRVGKNILPVYKFEDRVIWGVTARIVRSFAAFVSSEGLL